jgi:hypothetical protein
VRKGDAVAYRSIAGPVYAAVVADVRPCGFVDLDVNVGTKEPVRLNAIREDRIEPRETA